MQYYAAPMEGLTSAVYRKAHNQYFPGIDKYFTPFLAVTQHHCFTPRQLREIAPEYNCGIPVVPQLLTHSAQDFIWAARELYHRGFTEVNFNLGCPFGTVAAKRKGAGFLAYPEELDRFLDEIFAQTDCPEISIKTRLGVRDAAEFARILEIFNQYPIAELTVHPRVQQDFYRGMVRMEAFSEAVTQMRRPVCYNGDMTSVPDLERIAEDFPQVTAVMIGRGLIANPALVCCAKKGAPLRKQTLHAFHDALYTGYCAAFGDCRNAARRMKEMWFYMIHLFREPEKHAKKLKKAETAHDYQAQVQAIFRDLDLLENPIPAWRR